MRCRSYDEKKGLIKLSSGDFEMQDQLRAKLAEIAGSSPPVKAFEINRPPVGPILLDPSQNEEFESLNPAILNSLQETTGLKLTRAARPMSFDVALLSRNVVEDQPYEQPLAWGVNDNTAEVEDDASDGGGQGGEDGD